MKHISQAHAYLKRRFPALMARMVLLAVLCLVSGMGRTQDDGTIDWDRARLLHQRVQRGEKLSPEDQSYYERAKKAYEARQNANRNPGQTPLQGSKESLGLTPLTDLGKGLYKKESGGLYGEGRNEPPARHLAAAKQEAAKIQPLDVQGQPSATGKIVLLSIGMSNTAMEFAAFLQVANRDPQKSPAVVIVNGAQGGKAAEQWLRPEESGASVWGVVDSNLKAAGVTAVQVQAVWIKQALIQPAQYGDYPAHAQRLEKDLGEIVRIARKRFPHLRIAYLSSRIYAGYAVTPLNPEPYSYESAFSIQHLIQAQIKGDLQLNYDPAHGPVNAPLLLWGPYLWADGVKGRKTDGLVWKREDLGADGTHPSESGRQKVAESLLRFFKTDPTTRSWFVQEQKTAATRNP